MSHRILIIDDDVDTLKLVGLMLERQGYEIIVAKSGEQGLSKAASDEPDLILLDIMMPDMDGYEVTRLLRGDPNLAHIPIIMFTAKSMVDDKVMGFEAGVDDYLTKPTHPAELTAHVKAILARTSKGYSIPAERGKIIGFLGARGGMGTSTLALNIGISLHQNSQEVVIVEMNPGRGTLALELGIENNAGLGNLLSLEPKGIHLRSVESELINHASGVRLLLTSHNPSDIELRHVLDKVLPVINNLNTLATVLLLDLGTTSPSRIKPVIDLCDGLVLVMEPIFPSTVFGKTLIEELLKIGISRQKINLALVTRMRTGFQIPWRKVETQMGIRVLGSIPPAAEIAHHASKSHRPLIVAQPESVISDQIHVLSEHLSESLQLATVSNRP
ncbi:MAG TPA: response regulator [Anaerolineae bacterium]|nr:response regulator [Anaerolineae bacterium]